MMDVKLIKHMKTFVHTRLFSPGRDNRHSAYLTVAFCHVGTCSIFPSNFHGFLKFVFKLISEQLMIGPKL